jgi:ferredoxin-NADP reductase
MHLAIDEYDPAGGFWPESRVFSIASCSGSERLTIVYSVKGRYTKLMEERLKPGLEVWIKLPFGDFIIDSRILPGSDVVLVAGGTGISPFIPFLEDTFESGTSNRKIRLYYGLRNPGLFLFREVLAKCAAKGLLDMRLYFESGSDGSESAIGFRAAGSGRLSPEKAYEESRDLRNPVFFLSGPPVMIELFKSSLLGAGLSRDRIQIDEWE